MATQEELMALKATAGAEVQAASAAKARAAASAKSGGDEAADAEAKLAAADKALIAAQAKLKEVEGQLAAAGAKAKTVASGVKHVVAAGETLSHIALKYYKTANRWQEIYEANKALIGGDPGMIKPGQELIVPNPEK